MLTQPVLDEDPSFYGQVTVGLCFGFIPPKFQAGFFSFCLVHSVNSNWWLDSSAGLNMICVRG